MAWTPKTFGLGPERITNEWLNALQGAIQSNSNILERHHGGVVWGCRPTFSVGSGGALEITVTEGAVISSGTYFDITAQTMVVIPPGAENQYFVWIYVSSAGELEVLAHEDPGPWPSDTPEPEDLEENLAVLGFGRIVLDGTWSWSFGHDIRQFVREKPNGAVLVVGDLDAGADFESLQQALDYLFACDAGANEVPRRILVTQSQAVDEPVRVRTDGVIIEGVLNEVGAPDPDSEDEDERIILTWSHGDGTQPSGGALFDLQSHSDIELRRLHLVREDTATWCAVYNARHRFLMEGCIVGTQGRDALLSVVVDFGDNATDGVRFEHNLVYGMRRGLFGYTATSEERPVAEGADVGWLRRSVVAHNYVSTMGLKEPRDPGKEWDECWDECGKDLSRVDRPPWTDPGQYFFAIDCGVYNDENNGSAFNTIRGNVVNRSMCGIRVGRFSSVRANLLHDTVLFGVLATVYPEGPPGSLVAGESDPVGATEIAANTITFTDFDDAPWWRAGIRLELTTCHVSDNAVLSGTAACGIVHGPLDLADTEARRDHFIALRDGGHAVVGNSIVLAPVDANGVVDHGQVSTRVGVGIALFSIQNRVTDNGIFHARTGIFATAYNVIANNVIEPAVLGIFAWSYNTVSGNTIGWYPHTANGFPWLPEELVSVQQVESELTPVKNVEIPPAPLGQGAIMLSLRNVCAGNAVACIGGGDPSGTVAVAIFAADWAKYLYGREFQKLFSKFWKSVDPLEQQLALRIGMVEPKVGGNLIEGATIHLANLEARSGGAGSYAVHGVVVDDTEPDTVISDVMIRSGLIGIWVRSGGASISGCTAWACRETALQVDGGHGSRISGCSFMTNYHRTANIGEHAAGTSVHDCLLWQISRSESRRPGMTCLQVDADQVQVNDCALLNYGSNCIDWNGSYGVCGGCWFLAGDRDPQGDPQSPQIRFAAIRFLRESFEDQNDPGAFYYPRAGTRGNLVHTAHMLNCSPLGKHDGETESSPVEWSNAFWMYDVSQSAQDFEKDNPDPPQYGSQQGRWTNRVAVESCHYWVWPTPPY